MKFCCASVYLYVFPPPAVRMFHLHSMKARKEREKKKKSALNKSSPEVDSITWAATQVKKSQIFQAQNSDAVALFQGRNTLHLNSAVPTDTICRKSITNWKRVAFIVNEFHHFSVPIYMSLLYAVMDFSMKQRDNTNSFTDALQNH